MDFGLIGHPLGHSFSKEIHESLGLYTYKICDLPEEKFEKFMTEKNFKGINVTIPYKQKVIPFLDEIDETAKEIETLYAYQRIISEHQLYLIRATCEHSLILLNHV